MKNARRTLHNVMGICSFYAFRMARKLAKHVCRILEWEIMTYIHVCNFHQFMALYFRNCSR